MRRFYADGHQAAVLPSGSNFQTNRGSSPVNNVFEEEDQVQDARICPACGATTAYSLSDGRMQCKLCRTKYTPGPRQARLDDQALRQIVTLFWSMYAQEMAARESGLNRKTMQRYFRLLREAIARQGQERMEQALTRTRLAGFFVGSRVNSESGKEKSEPLLVFSLGLLRDEVVLFLPDGLEDWSGLDLDGIRFVALAPDGQAGGNGKDADLAEVFWLFARPILKHYRGGAKKRLPCYLREMEFRFNHHDDSRVLERLHQLLLSGPA